MNEQDEDTFGWGNAAALLGGGLALSPMGAPLRKNLGTLAEKTGLDALAKRALNAPSPNPHRAPLSGDTPGMGAKPGGLDGLGTPGGIDELGNLGGMADLKQTQRTPFGSAIDSLDEAVTLKPGALAAGLDTYRAGRGTPSSDWGDSVANLKLMGTNASAAVDGLRAALDWGSLSRKLGTMSPELADAYKVTAKASVTPPRVPTVRELIDESKEFAGKNPGAEVLTIKQAQTKRTALKDVARGRYYDMLTRNKEARTFLKTGPATRFSNEDKVAIHKLYTSNPSIKTPEAATIRYFQLKELDEAARAAEAAA